MPSTPGEHPNTYFVQDRASESELQRLRLQDALLTAGMGGVLPEQLDPTRLRRVLDVGCGTGGWLIATAQAYPVIQMLHGVDVSRRMVEDARAQAEAAQVSDRVEFHVMDALRMLEYPEATFDLVNQRFGGSFLRTWDWRKLLEESQRVCRHGGVIRITEANFHVRSTSAALEQLFLLLVRAFHRAGHLFVPQGDGLSSELVPLLQRFGLQQVQTRALTLHYCQGAPEWPSFVEDVRRVFRTGLPFVQKWIRVPDDYEALYQRALAELGQPESRGALDLLTVWGERAAR
ncbi:MAG TPA: methyltransferase domain-containing protein [Ktedonobacteraceae bacterium]|nr:methyltransferase domain-containing protein [Ktedonobacteraceae bacterium]